ncbi:MAG: hypothetical protein ACREL5_06645 [Gemmatimonadales bacterium]
MPKTQISGWVHEPLTAILSSRAKVAVLRILGNADEPLAYREVVRRSGMAYRSVEFALADLAAVGIIREFSGGRERRVELRRDHRLVASLQRLLDAEHDFFPSIRIELRAWTRTLAGSGLLSAAIVGAATRREESLGEGVQLVAVAADSGSVAICRQRFAAVAELLRARFGVTVTLLAYDLAAARTMWRAPTAAARRDVRGAELIGGTPLEVLLSGESGEVAPFA